MSADLFKAARHAATKAYANESKLQVGAALRTTSGAVFAGCNVENVAYPQGWCAETTALGAFVMGGFGKGDLAEVAVFAPKMDRITPCGGCRQKLKEFGTAGTKVHLCDATGVVETLRLGDLLPHAFDM